MAKKGDTLKSLAGVPSGFVAYADTVQTSGSGLSTSTAPVIARWR